jgi:hypothetical protein
MEHVVEAGSRRQLQLIGDIVDDGGDAVRPEEARLELPGRRYVKRGGGPLAQSEPDPILGLALCMLTEEADQRGVNESQ